MKYKSIIILISLLLFSIANGEEVKENNIMCSEPDAYTPSSASLFIEIVEISKAVEFLNARKEFFKISNLLFTYETLMYRLKDKAGIDVLNPESLKKTGIDVDRSLYIATIENSTNAAESIFFIPIINKKNFPFTFVKILKKLTDHITDLDLNPAISSYNNFNVYQIQPKIFFTIFDDYFILTPSGNSLTEIIDLKSKECDSSLSMDPLYKDYKIKSEGNNANIINIFLKKEFLNRVYKRIQEKNDKTKSSSKSLFEPRFDFINYIFLSLERELDEISITGTLAINKEDQLGKFLNEIAMPGMIEKAFYADNPIGYHFLSIDFDKLNNYCEVLTNKNNTICTSFTKLLRFIRQRGILLKDPVFPCSKSFINVIFKKPKIIGEMDSFILYIPMKECGEIEDMVENIKDSLEDRYTDERFGEEKINEIESFWFKNDSNNKINIFEFDNNLYAGNDIDMIKDFLNPSDKNLLNVQKNFVKKIDKNTFLLSYSQFDEESIIKAILMMIAFKENPVLYSFIGKMESIYIIGKRIDYDFNFNFNIKIVSSQ